MALKFLNKKGWHTGSLRNIENVWKAEQKHEAEQKKLEELRRQIQEERERNEFRQLQEQAGLVPRQERLEFLYDSGLTVGRSDGGGGGGSSSGVAFKALESTSTTGDSKQQQQQQQSSSSAAPGALFGEEGSKPHSANDAWRKLHSDPLLLIRQREQEALKRIKDNPVQMAMIRKSVDEKKNKKKEKKKKSGDDKEGKRKHRHRKKYSSSEYSDPEDDGAERDRRKKSRKEKSRDDKVHHKRRAESEDESPRGDRSNKNHYEESRIREFSSRGLSDHKYSKSDGRHDKDESERERSFRVQSERGAERRERCKGNEERHDTHYKRRNVALKLTEEERAAKLWEMQMDAEVHEEQRWKRLKKAEEDDKRELARASGNAGRNFLDAAQKSMYGAEKGGSSTIEESVRRRTYYSQRRTEAEGNAFRRS